MKTKHLVIDTAAFVKNLPLWEYAEELYSVPEVIAELRDRATRQRYESLPVAVKMRQPQPWALRFINQFSKKTGDYASLSLADVKLLALAYELEIEAHGSSTHLRAEPQKCTIEGPTSNSGSNDKNIEGFHLPAEELEVSDAADLNEEAVLPDNELQVDMSTLTLADQDEAVQNANEEDGNAGLEESGIEDDSGSFTDESEEESENSNSNENTEVEHQNQRKESESEEYYEIDEDEDDDDEGWITPSNIKKHKLQNPDAIPDEEKDKDVLVACVTADFAMQNVLKHIGLSVMGVDGKIIRQIRTFILRCYACFKLCSDMSKIFCPKCGNKTLKRVSVTVNPDGTQKVWINFKRQISTKGMIYTIPRPRGGQHARNPILVADQKEVRQFSTKSSKKKLNPMHEDYNPEDDTPFAMRDVYSRAAQLGYMGGKCHNHYYWEQKNPNARGVRNGKKKKK